ncbi:MAG: hypothetical protein II905_04390, partial [Muribaculaceae bacterium]|nr:hypothetical protein [Muribaculaceae bacterium]
MAKQELTLEQKQTQRMALEQQRMLGQMLEKNDAEMTEFIDNKVNENQALEKKNDEDDEMGGSEPDRDTNARNNDAANDMVGVDNGDDDTMAWYRYFANNRSTDDEYHGPTAVSEKTMQEVLLDQLREMELDETQQIIAQT